MQSSHHNRLNLRDTSAEPGNIFGDTNLPARANNIDGEDSDDLNDRQPIEDILMTPELPSLETVHVPH